MIVFTPTPGTSTYYVYYMPYTQSGIGQTHLKWDASGAVGGPAASLLGPVVDMRGPTARVPSRVASALSSEAGGGGDVFVHQTQIYARGFRSLAEGEEVEYEVELDESGRQRAISVTGPEGDYVQGAPRPPRADDYDAKYDETY